MGDQEKRSYVSILSNFIIFSIYIVKMIEMNDAGLFKGPDASSLAGQMVLWAVLGGVIFHMIIQIIFSIMNAIVTREEISYFSDERDKLMEIKGMQFFAIIVGIGFIISMTVLALDLSIFWAFNIMVLSFPIGDTMSNGIKIFNYRQEA